MSSPTDEPMCACGHSAHWHADDGQGDCEGVHIAAPGSFVPCGCEEFVAPRGDAEPYVEVRRSVDLRSLLEEAAHLLWESREHMGAPQTYKRVEDDLRAVVAELDARAAEASSG